MKNRQMFPWTFALAAMLTLLILGGSVLAQEISPTNWNQEYDPYVSALGITGGYSSGVGLAFRWPALPQTMITAAGGAWGESGDMAWNLGLEAHYILRQVGRTRFFVGPSVAMISDKDDGQADVNVSLGIGLETLLQDRVSVKLDLGFTYLGDSESIYPLPQIGFFYYF